MNFSRLTETDYFNQQSTRFRRPIAVWVNYDLLPVDTFIYFLKLIEPFTIVVTRGGFTILCQSIFSMLPTTPPWVRAQGPIHYDYHL